jgi:hypothetical protein
MVTDSDSGARNSQELIAGIDNRTLAKGKKAPKVVTK